MNLYGRFKIMFYIYDDCVLGLTCIKSLRKELPYAPLRADCIPTLLVFIIIVNVPGNLIYFFGNVIKFFTVWNSKYVVELMQTRSR